MAKNDHPADTYENGSQSRPSVGVGQSARHHTTTSNGNINGIGHIVNLIAGQTGTD
jgi:hypothetical protein